MRTFKWNASENDFKQFPLLWFSVRFYLIFIFVLHSLWLYLVNVHNTSIEIISKSSIAAYTWRMENA